MNIHESTQAAVQRQGWREDGRVDIDAVRETVESGEVTKHRAEDQLIELCNEVERLREQNAKASELFHQNVDSLTGQLDEATAEIDRLRAAENLLRETAKALTVPLPARTVEAEREYLWTLARRASVVKESVDAALDPADAADFDMAAGNVRSQAPLQIAMYQIRESGEVR